ncbi:uncharacterized protein LOC129801850 [Phlebotomus papatasi]|uniref:uncharacterized protein LOC129801850 n=1 Tax=Phlebotomus papatasi TaxID=29031 RepID=UPI00248376FE|nr:uncharacterized protein LOC129801850 [Phlebotomus papatasi]
MNNFQNYRNFGTNSIPGKDHFAKIPQKLQNFQENVSRTENNERIKPQSFYAGISVPDGDSSNIGNGLKRKIPESLLTVKKIIRVHEVSKGDKLNEEFCYRDNLSGNSRKKGPEQTKFAPMPSLQIITGNIAQIQKMNKELEGQNFLFETHAKLLLVKEGKYTCEKLILLRNESGPVLQGVFYEIDHKLPANVEEGQIVRCVGRFNHYNRFNIMKISSTNSAFVDLSNRLHAISHFTINKDNKH